MPGVTFQRLHVYLSWAFPGESIFMIWLLKRSNCNICSVTTPANPLENQSQAAGVNLLRPKANTQTQSAMLTYKIHNLYRSSKEKCEMESQVS